VEEDRGHPMMMQSREVYARASIHLVYLICSLWLVHAADTGGGVKINHKKELFPLSEWDIVGFVLIAIAQLVTAGGGIGAGAILVPTYIWVMDFPQKLAIPLANVTVFGGAIAITGIHMISRHPVADRPLIDFDLALALEPLTTAGALVGSLVQRVSPDFLIGWIFVLIVGFVTFTTFEKGVDMMAKERDAESASGQETAGLLGGDRGDKPVPIVEEQEENPASAEAPVGSLPPPTKAEETSGEEEEQLERDGQLQDKEVGGASAGKAEDAPSELSPECLEILEDEKTIAWWKVGLNFVVLGGVFIFGFIGSEYAKCGDSLFWGLLAANLGYVVAISCGILAYLVWRTQKKVDAGYRFADGDIQFQAARTAILGGLCFLAGIFAGTFGVGGGLLKGPLMLEYKVLPQVATATAAYMLFFTTGTSTVAYAFFDMIPWDYASFMIAEGFIFGLIGQLLANWIIKRTGKKSLLIMMIAGICGLSTILMLVRSCMLSVDVANGVEHIKFSLCGAH